MTITITLCDVCTKNVITCSTFGGCIVLQFMVPVYSACLLLSHTHAHTTHTHTHTLTHSHTHTHTQVQKDPCVSVTLTRLPKWRMHKHHTLEPKQAQILWGEIYLFDMIEEGLI